MKWSREKISRKEGVTMIGRVPYGNNTFVNNRWTKFNSDLLESSILWVSVILIWREVSYWLLNSHYQSYMASLVAQTLKNLPAKLETWLWSLGREDPLEEGMATLSSILAWRISIDRGACGLQSMGPQRVGHDWGTMHSTTSGIHGQHLTLIYTVQLW